MAKIKLKVRLNSTFSEEFQTTVCAFEGDSLSGCLFPLALAAALNHVRLRINSSYLPIAENGKPTETEYADNVEFLDEKIKHLRQNFPIIKSTLKLWNLEVSDSKTEFVKSYLASKNDLNIKMVKN